MTSVFPSGYAVYQALDHGLQAEQERNLTEPLNTLINNMTASGEYALDEGKKMKPNRFVIQLGPVRIYHHHHEGGLERSISTFLNFDLQFKYDITLAKTVFLIIYSDVVFWPERRLYKRLCPFIGPLVHSVVRIGLCIREIVFLRMSPWLM